MFQNNSITKKQHYIAQVYLRGFSPDYLRKKEKATATEKYTIYCYALESEEQSKKAVGLNPYVIKNICMRCLMSRDKLLFRIILNIALQNWKKCLENTGRN